MTRARDVANIDGLLTTKGDIYAATAAATPDRLGVGNNGETLVADSSATTGLRYSPTPSASNPILNSAFQVWQRGTSFSFNNEGKFTADRWCPAIPNTGATVSRQTTSDTTNLPFIQYCARLARNSGTTSTGTIGITQSFETVNSLPFAGKTVTMSFYARAGANFSASGSSIVTYLITGTGTDQNHAIGGYTGQATPVNSTATLTTTWQRFSFTGTIAATATEIAVNTGYTPVGTAGANDYYEITGWQIDVGSVALPFRTYAGTIQGELAACQRYFAIYAQDSDVIGSGVVTGSANAYIYSKLPQSMRIAPSLTYVSGANIEQSGTKTVSAITMAVVGKQGAGLACTIVGATNGFGCILYISGSGSVQYSAEL
jgi:hypothetical protein